VEIRVDTRIQTRINVKYNKPDIFILDKVKKELIIVEVGITSFDTNSGNREEKQISSNHCAAIHKVANTKIIPYVMTWEGVVTKQYHCRDLGIDRKIEAYVQTKEMTFESMSIMRRTIS
jgi:hypothetical protein